MVMNEAKRAADGREQPRIDVQVEVTMESDHNFYTGLTSNISEGGLFVATHFLLPVGSRLQVRMTVPGRDQPIDALVEVRWLREGRFADLPPGMGLRFVEMDPDCIHVISRFAQERETIFYED